MDPIINLKYAALEIEREGKKKKKNLSSQNKQEPTLEHNNFWFPCSVCVRVPVCCVNLIGFSQQSLSCVPVLSL